MRQSRVENRGWSLVRCCKRFCYSGYWHGYRWNTRGIVSGMGAEALVDWLRGFLSKTDIDLLLDPTKRLTCAGYFVHPLIFWGESDPLHLPILAHKLERFLGGKLLPFG